MVVSEYTDEDSLQELDAKRVKHLDEVIEEDDLSSL
jgi:hypothetical protein